MPNPLIPELTGRRLTVDAALKQPNIIRDQIAKLADSTLLLPKVFRPFGAQVQAGGLLYSVIAASDFFTSDVEKRAPGAEYRLVEGVQPTPQLALVEDWGGKFAVTDEMRTRNDISYLDQQTTQLANTIARKLDTRAVAALAAAPIGSVVVTGTWDSLQFLGPDAGLTASVDRPTAHFAQAQELADLEELGVQHDSLLVHPNQARALREAYAENLTAMLASVGLTMHSNPRLPAGTAYVCQGGQVGTVGFEHVLTVDVWPDPATRSTWVQAFAVPAFAIDKPYCAKKITHLA